MKSKSAIIVLTSCLIVSSANAADILLVSDSCAPDGGCEPNQRDDTFVEFLEDLGHTVDTSGMGEAYHSSTTWWADGGKVAAMDDADLVIVSRRTNSGSYRGGIASQAWNGTETPILLMSAFITRDSRWGWQTGGDIGATNAEETEMVILDDTSPLVAGLSGEAQVFDWSGPSIGGNDNPNPGVWPKNVAAPQIDSVIDGGQVIGQYDDRAFLIHYPAGTSWNVVDDGEGGSQDGEFGGDRVFLGHWGYDIENYNFLDLTTGDFLQIVESTVDFLAPGDMGPACDFDASGVCDVADLNQLMYTGLSSGDLQFDLDGNGTVDLGDRDALLREINSLPGDANNDGVTNAADLNALGSNWQREGLTSWEQGDFDGNGIGNAADLNIVGGNWQKTAADFAAAPLAATAAVPEPGSLGLLLISLLGLLRFRCK